MLITINFLKLKPNGILTFVTIKCRIDPVLQIIDIHLNCIRTKSKIIKQFTSFAEDPKFQEMKSNFIYVDNFSQMFLISISNIN